MLCSRLCSKLLQASGGEVNLTGAVKKGSRSEAHNNRDSAVTSMADPTRELKNPSKPQEPTHLQTENLCGGYVEVEHKCPPCGMALRSGNSSTCCKNATSWICHMLTGHAV